MKVQNPGNTDNRGVLGQVLLPFIGGEEEPFPLGEDIRQLLAFTPFDDVILFAPASVKERFLTLDAHLSNETHVRTTFTFEGSKLVFPFAEVKPLESALLPGAFFFGQDGNSDGPGYIVVLGDDDVLPKPPFEGGHYPLVEGRTPLEEDAVSDPFFPHYPVEVILDDGVTQSRHEIIGPGGSLLMVYQI